MTDMHDYYLAQRYATDMGVFQYETEAREDGTEITYASKRLGLLKSDIVNGGAPIGADRIRELVKAFKEISLTEDDAEFARFAIASREVLYKQLAEAYTFGLACFSNIYNDDHLCTVLAEYGLKEHARSLTHKRRYNKWNAITALLYGEWEKASYKRNRSAEKYGCVLAMLEHKNVKVEDAFNYIKNYKIKIKSDGKSYGGIIAMEKHYRAINAPNKNGNTKTNKKRIAARNAIIARIENPSLNDAVFEIPKPDHLRDAVKFGQVTFKRIGDAATGYKLLVIACDTWEEAQYQKFAYSLGKKAYEEEQALQAKADADAKNKAENAASIVAGIEQSPEFLEAVANGVDADVLLNKILSVVGNAAKIKKNTDHLEEYFDPE